MLLFINQAILMVMATVLGWRHSSELFEELRQMGLVGKAKDQGGLLNGVVRGRQMGLDIFHQIQCFWAICPPPVGTPDRDSGC